MRVGAGYYIAGNGLGETEAEWRDIVATAKRDLPPGRPLFVCGAPTPHAVLEQVRLGFDVIESRCALRPATPLAAAPHTMFLFPPPVAHQLPP